METSIDRSTTELQKLLDFNYENETTLPEEKFEQLVEVTKKLQQVSTTLIKSILNLKNTIKWQSDVIGLIMDKLGIDKTEVDIWISKNI